MTALIIVLLFSLASAIYIAVTIKASDLRIITHYSAYGITHFYRDSWRYLLAFIGFIFLTFFFAVGVGVKLLRHERESLALLFSWISCALFHLVSERDCIVFLK
jgi:TRAP-type C4-dicarboxylate transport system permease small subunit